MKSIQLYYATCKNFGDALSPRLIENILGVPTECAPFHRAELVAVGSVLFSGSGLFSEKYPISSMQGIRSRLAQLEGMLVCPELKIWGSGFLAPRLVKNPMPRRRVALLATRGKLTHEILKSQGVVKKGVRCAYGDPGLLYRDLLSAFPEKKYDVGLIPHMADRVIGRYLEGILVGTGLRVKYIHVEDDPLSVLMQVAECERVLSSSLHGCIVADSLGIPNRQMMVSWLGLGCEDFMFKFRDYYSAFGREPPAPVTLDELLSTPLTVVNEMPNCVVTPDQIDEVSNKLRVALKEGMPV